MVLATVKTIVEYMEELAPAAVALPGDSVGLQLGNPDASVTRILVVLDSDSASIEAACSWGAELLVTHHPLFHRALSSIDESSPKGALVAAAIRHRLNIFCAHTNFDVVPHGVSFQLATSLGLSVEEGQVLDPTGNEQLLKLVVFIPVGYEDKVRNALAGAGAGYIGNYSHCTFQTLGMGTFMPGVGTEPFVGVTGRVEKVDEIRLETI
ncbi:MAG TPA: Nif3-like dinuclear metal center hexameric protein, partial [Candidatus Limnocylindrales bacterium]|nr:Nif3-like dinuclear metal center hexameric protein [Candidatus Limnocylindrales bacterium]